MEPVVEFRDVVTTRDVAAYSEAARSLRRWMIENDPHYPSYHFVGPEGWIGDPNGPIFYRGRYHLFYQCSPVVDGEAGRVCWGHAVSDDLVHWDDWPVAIWPDFPGDQTGVFSGNSFVADNGDLGAIYTGVVDATDVIAGQAETAGVLATSSDDGLTWQKKVVMHDRQRPGPFSPVHWDGYLWREGEKWYQLVGGTTAGKGDAARQGAAWLWTSDDLEEWVLKKNIAPDVRLGNYWELPYLIHLDGKDVLLVGAEDDVSNPYWVGDFDREDLCFRPDAPAPKFIDTGNYYSFNVNMTDGRGAQGAKRQLMHGSVWGPASPTPSVPRWQNLHSIPRVIDLREGRIWQEPIPELRCLRGERLDLRDGPAPGRLAIDGDALEIRATFVPGAGRCGVKLLVSADGDRFVRVFFDTQTGEFGVDGPTIESSIEGLKHIPERAAQIRVATQPAFLGRGDEVSMQIFLDRSVIEVFVNGCAYTTRVFAPKEDRGVELFSDGNGATVRDVDVWLMNSMWE
jgi:beta-fructofuranosidase